MHGHIGTEPAGLDPHPEIHEGGREPFVESPPLVGPSASGGTLARAVFCGVREQWFDRVECGAGFDAAHSVSFAHSAAAGMAMAPHRTMQHC